MLGRCNLEIFSLSGDKMRNIPLPVSGNKEITYTFNRAGLSSGLYIYRILDNSAILFEGKIIVQ
jgi:hypothetical protein